MNLQVIAEHTIDLDLLPQHASILDAGCLGFAFYDEMKRRGHKVVALDIQELDRSKDYVRMALTGKDGTVGIWKSSDPQAARVMEGDEISSATIETISQITDTPFWDVIKLDIEGAEYGVIMSLKEAPAKQISIEFHLHTGIYSVPDMTVMVGKLSSLGYKIVQHEIESRHGAGMNYWDSLFVLEN